MGYELHATLSSENDTQDFLVAPGRSSTNLVLEAIAQRFPAAMDHTHASGYPAAELGPNDAVILLDAWHADLLVQTHPDTDTLDPNRFGAGIAEGFLDVLVGYVADMRALAAAGYTLRFAAE